VTKIGLIDEDAESGRSRIEILRGLATEAGFEVVGVALVDFESNDFTAQLQQLRDDGAEAIVGQLSGAPIGVFAQGLEDLAWDVPVMGNASWAAAPLLDLVPESVRPQIQFAQNVSGGRTGPDLSEGQLELIANIEGAGDELINLSVHAAGFDLVLAMKYAFDTAGSLDGAAVIAAAEGMSEDPASAELPWQFFPGQGPMFSAEYHNPSLVDVSDLFLLCSIGELVQGTWPCEPLTT
jgi:ABC-type branched-subunit amino acid transport system substrate-binding protein